MSYLNNASSVNDIIAKLTCDDTNTSIVSSSANYVSSSPYQMTVAVPYQSPDVVSNVNSIVSETFRRNMEVAKRTEELAKRYHSIQCCANANQEWLDNQNVFQRVVYGVTGKTKRVERQVNACTRESVGVLAETVDVLYKQNNMLMNTVAALAIMYGRQEAIRNQQNMVYNEMFRRISERMR